MHARLLARLFTPHHSHLVGQWRHCHLTKCGNISVRLLSVGRLTLSLHSLLHVTISGLRRLITVRHDCPEPLVKLGGEEKTRHLVTLLLGSKLANVINLKFIDQDLLCRKAKQRIRGIFVF